jgi:ABC-type polysaccharide/polyol phosphate transport system ATPase subunit
VRETLARGGVAIAAGHDHEILSRICGRGLLMERGRIVARGPFEQVRATYLDRDLPDSLGDRIGPVPRVPGSSS